jgi:hypothetical protein
MPTFARRRIARTKSISRYDTEGTLHGRIIDETSDMKTEEVIMCCVIRAVAHLKGAIACKYEAMAA